MRRIGLGLFIIGITFAKAYGQEDYGPVNTGAANYLTIPADARSAAMGGVGVHGCVTMSPDTLFIAWVVFTKSISVMPFC